MSNNPNYSYKSVDTKEEKGVSLYINHKIHHTYYQAKLVIKVSKYVCLLCMTFLVSDEDEYRNKCDSSSTVDRLEVVFFYTS